MEKEEIIQLIQQQIQAEKQNSQYGVSRVPVHTHNNIDSPNLQQHSIVGFQTLPSALGTVEAPDGSMTLVQGVANPALLNGQALTFGDQTVGTEGFNSYTSMYVYPLPVIYGYGTTSSDTLFTASKTLTGTPIAGATTATMTTLWGSATGQYWGTFTSGESRLITFTNASANISWTTGLVAGAGGTGLAIGLPGVGAVSASLSGNWGGTTGTYGVQFDTGEIRNITFTNGSALLSWTTALLYAVGSATITIVGNARFHGGAAPYGTALIFRNDDDGILQLWVRTKAGTFIESWASVTLTLSIID